MQKLTEINSFAKCIHTSFKTNWLCTNEKTAEILSKTIFNNKISKVYFLQDQ